MNHLIHPELDDILRPELAPPKPKVEYIPAWVLRSARRYEEWQKGGWGRDTDPFRER